MRFRRRACHRKSREGCIVCGRRVVFVCVFLPFDGSAAVYYGKCDACTVQQVDDVITRGQ